MPKKYVPVAEHLKADGRERRLRAHRHNSYHGYVAMSECQMIQILHADTTTDETKDIAADILARLRELKDALKTRRD